LNEFFKKRKFVKFLFLKKINPFFKKLINEKLVYFYFLEKKNGYSEIKELELKKNSNHSKNL
jgi:hypothetical protein